MSRAQGKVHVPRRVLREFPDRGAQWTLGDIHLAAGLLRHARPALADMLDFSRARRMPRTFIPPAFRKQENDVLWFVPYRLEGVGEGEFAEGIYLLVEHQTNPERLQVLRALTHATTVWEQEAREWGRSAGDEAQVAAADEAAADRRCLHPVVCMVLQTGSRSWAELRTLRQLMSRADGAQDTIPHFAVLLVRLADLTEEHLARMPPGLTAFLRMMRVREQTAPAVEAALARALAGLATLDAEAEQTWQRVLHFCTMFVWSERPEAEQETLLDLLAEAADRRRAGSAREVRNVVRSMREVVEERAEARGEQQGEVRAARRMLLTLLETRWGAVPEDVRQAVEGLSDATEAQETLRRMVRAGTLAEVRTALNGSLTAG